MTTNIIGTCGKCGGPVVTDMFYSGYQRPYCQCCHARAKNAFGQRIEMEDLKIPAETWYWVRIVLG